MKRRRHTDILAKELREREREKEREREREREREGGREGGVSRLTIIDEGI